MKTLLVAASMALSLTGCTVGKHTCYEAITCSIAQVQADNEAQAARDEAREAKPVQKATYKPTSSTASYKPTQAEVQAHNEAVKQCKLYTATIKMNTGASVQLMSEEKISNITYCTGLMSDGVTGEKSIIRIQGNGDNFKY